MLRVYAFEADGIERVVDDPDDISELIQADDTLVWVDVVEATDDDLELIGREFGLHHLAIEDARKHGQRAKLEMYPTHAFIVAYASGPDPAELPEVDVFIGQQWLVTVRERDAGGTHFDIDAVRERHDRSRDGAHSVGFLLWTVLDEVVDSFFDGLDRIEDELEVLEERIFDSTSSADDREIQRCILALREKLVYLRRRIVPMRDVVMAILRREIPWVDGANTVLFQDVLDHLLRIIDQVDVIRELLGNAVDAHLGLVSNRMNDIMKKTSSWGAILLGSTLIAGIYGMNFRDMPELRWTLGYPAALVSMALLTAVLYTFFKRRDWL